MANTYSWDIPAVDCRPTEGDLSTVVYNVHWRYNADDGKGNTATIIGTQTVGSPDPENFKPFADLTKDIVVSWIEPEMDMAEMKSNVDAQIAEKENPTTETLPLPSDNGGE
jgi:hypothetical protein|tara:strand:+ start:1478 stop:1810 length:333 start_codon:yes stop_codon:yes gene_type:complete